MGLDIRIPIGGMFIILGALLAAYGAYTKGDPMYLRSLNMNMNLLWGLVMLTFGGMMFYFGMRAKPQPPKQ
jgi:hypothetical protein